MVSLRQDFVVKKGAQVASNVVIGTYAGANAAPVGGMIVSGNVGIGTATVDSNVAVQISGSLGSTDYYMDDTANYPGYAPSLYLNFVGSNLLDSRISFIRASTATYVGADGYIKTAPINVPRFDYDPSYSPPRPKGLLIEQSSVNLVLQSTFQSGWSGGAAAGTLTANQLLSPDGTVNAAQYVESMAASSFHYKAQNVTKAASALVYTFSVFLKASGNRQVGLRMEDTGGTNGAAVVCDPVSGTIATAGVYGTFTSASATIRTIVNGWYRFSLTATSSTDTLLTLQLETLNAGNNVYTGDGVSGFYCFGAQLEQLTFLTSYIPTAASTVSRAAELVNMPASSSWYNPLSSSLLVEASKNSANDASYGGIVEINDNSANNRFTFYVGLNTATINFSDNYSTNLGDGFLALGNFTVGAPYKIAGSISQGSIAASINGNLAVTGTTSNFPGSLLTNLAIGHLGAAGNYHNGWIRSISYWPRSLTTTQLSNITKV